MALLAREAALRRELERRETAHRDTIERTEALRERAEKAERERQEADERYIHRDREIAALRAKLAEAERQKEVHERNYQAMYMFKDERDAAVAERDAAREEVKRLRAALRDTFQEYENSDPDCMMGEILARHGIDSAALTQSSTPTTEAEK
jgi:chromosome segregation ATPase